MLDYIRIACAVPEVKPADVKKNTDEILKLMAQAEEKAVDLLVFPELAVTGYTCGDLFFQTTLQDAALTALEEIMDESRRYPGLHLVVGLPVAIGGRLYNCAARSEEHTSELQSR